MPQALQWISNFKLLVGISGEFWMEVSQTIGDFNPWKSCCLIKDLVGKFVDERGVR